MYSGLPCAAEGMNGNPLWEAKGSGKVVASYRSGLILNVTCHWEVVVFSNLKSLGFKVVTFRSRFKYSNLKIVGVHPVNWSLPVTSRFDNHPYKRLKYTIIEQNPLLCRFSPDSSTNVAPWLIVGDLLPIAPPLSSRGPFLAELSAFWWLESGHPASWAPELL